MAKSVVTVKGLKIAIMMAMLVIIFAGIKSAADIIVPFILALFLAFVFNPLIVRLERIRFPRPLAVLLVAALVVMLMVFLTSMLIVTLNDFGRTLPQYRGLILQKFEDLQNLLQINGLVFSFETLAGYFDPGYAINLISRLITHLSNAMAGVFLLVMTVVFMLLEVPQLPYKLNQLAESSEEEPGAGSIQRALDSVTRYLVIKTLISVATGLTIWALLALLGVRFAFLWGLLAFALNYIPNIGSIIAAIPPIIQAFLFNGVSEGVTLIAGYLAINLIIGNIVEPRILGKGLGLSTLVVFMSLIFWGWLMGPVGMLLSVPLTIVLKIAFEPTVAGHKIAVLLGDGKPAR
ncbi:AI-2E family transporter [Ewingella americana]|jgi:AI-2 transport protein TqsA|uniref:Transport of quorum-sensing signal protein n=2 Tax=Ewingella americana TaxID=41202 RepID=A0A377NDI1_9GAMM|nr:AI-2E family transporter [Ewingella americana]KAA8730276.1 AI-2E family transporter [Ewingella americana]KFC80903.1 putative transport protein [Ewingella americana ATCC 33852]STQ44026.1 Transport of quorum-sensing signal protein [Ewingella americana]